MVRENLLRKKLLNGEPTVATRIWSTNPLITETVGTSGNFDYVEFAAEYSAFSQRDLEDICRAAELYELAAIITVDFQNRGYVAQKALAAGFQGIMFADHETPEHVEESIRLTMPATPDSGGLFGYPSRRFIGCQTHIPPMEQAAHMKEVVRCFMIEKVRALDSIEEVKRSLLIALIDRKVSKYFSEKDSIIKKLEKDKYFVVFRHKYLDQLIKDKFSILEEVKTIKVGNEMAVTLSIGIGISTASYSQKYEYSRMSIDLALGLGGDQVVVK